MMVTVPNKPKTPLRNVRIEDQLWQEAKQVASVLGENVSGVIRAHLEEYVAKNREVLAESKMER